METRQLGHTDLHLTTIGLGTWAMGGGGWRFGWGPQDDRASVAAVHRALDSGVNWVDTAAIYGLGHAEEVVGEALAGRRDAVVLATKCGRVWEPGSTEIGKCLKAASIRREIEASLRRLRTDRIDLYQVHWPEPDGDIEEAWAAVAELVGEGKVRHAGVSNFSVAQIERVRPIHPVASLQPPYSMLRREVEADLLPHCAAHGIGVIAYSPMQAGLLTGKYTRERVAALPESDWRRSISPFFQEPQLTANLAAVDRLRPLAERAGRSLSQLALAWVLRRPEVTAAIVGARSPEQIAETVQAAGWRLPESIGDEIETILEEREAALG